MSSEISAPLASSSDSSGEDMEGTQKLQSSSKCESASLPPSLKYRNLSKLARRKALAAKNLTEDELQDLRLKINGRERKRMHDLNSAMDGLR